MRITAFNIEKIFRKIAASIMIIFLGIICVPPIVILSALNISMDWLGRVTYGLLERLDAFMIKQYERAKDFSVSEKEKAWNVLQGKRR